MRSRMLFSFFEADKQYIVAQPSTIIQYIIGGQVTALSYADLPPIKYILYDHVRHNQALKAKRDYLKQHNKTINNYKLKGCRIRR